MSTPTMVPASTPYKEKKYPLSGPDRSHPMLPNSHQNLRYSLYAYVIFIFLFVYPS